MMSPVNRDSTSPNGRRSKNSGGSRRRGSNSRIRRSRTNLAPTHVERGLVGERPRTMDQGNPKTGTAQSWEPDGNRAGADLVNQHLEQPNRRWLHAGVNPTKARSPTATHAAALSKAGSTTGASANTWALSASRSGATRASHIPDAGRQYVSEQPDPTLCRNQSTSGCCPVRKICSGGGTPSGMQVVSPIMGGLGSHLPGMKLTLSRDARTGLAHSIYMLLKV